MQIVIASGKGGTGKTSVAVNLAIALTESHPNALTFLDCDVEAPNAALFLRPSFQKTFSVEHLIPQVDEALCDHCGACAKFCQFNALTVTANQVLFFPELCHACGGCTLVCPQKAIHEISASIGIIRSGDSNGIRFSHGELQIGLPSPVGIIERMLKDQEKYLKAQEQHDSITIIDAPPGVSCPVVATLDGADFVILVTEPTPFGLHDLKQAVQLVRDEMHLPMGVVINKDGAGDDQVDLYCHENDIAIIGRIPYSRNIAEVYARGELLVNTKPEYKVIFLDIWNTIQQMQNDTGAQA